MRKISRLFVAAAAAGPLALGLSLTAAAPASASPATESTQAALKRAKQQCPIDQVCFWEKPRWEGDPVAVDPWNLPVCGATPNIARSVVNNSQDIYTFYSKEDCVDAQATIGGGGAHPEIEPPAVSWR